MSAILSTSRIFGLVLIGLMITACPNGTSSNTSNGGGGNNNGGGGGNNTLTVSVPSLGASETVTKNTTLGEINSARANLEAQCRARYPISRNTQQNQQQLDCFREVETAYNQAINFINR
ncbi:hypothetical protein NWP22_14990 [Anabaenopsis tanganyikae CS-531]|uniref:Uncharacterized protein n=1 Tax=Anabaenopsis tanganyikae CS-531 TaxID=2785304 RepID=A0ABT6KIF1_9CYAN|nr:hypothetical protein [Anabaenopsis tanganyikae]MDH6107151.1 hypothetical protein [Anabaenopsis tanganyikae CS-531]